MLLERLVSGEARGRYPVGEMVEFHPLPDYPSLASPVVALRWMAASLRRSWRVELSARIAALGLAEHAELHGYVPLAEDEVARERLIRVGHEYVLGHTLDSEARRVVDFLRGSREPSLTQEGTVSSAR